MRRLVLPPMVGCVLWLLTSASPALADNGPHMKGQGLTPDTCAMCHRAHTAQAPFLLKENQQALCFTCHGSSGTGSNLDVEGGIGYSGAGRSGGASGALRGGGFKYALIDTSKPEPVRDSTGKLLEATIKTYASTEPQPTTSAHSINESSQMAWGNGAINASANYGNAVSLACGSCHDPHGNGMYRILRPIPTESGAAKPGVEIPEPAGMTHVYTTANYWQTWDNNDPTFEYKISAWCATCHTRLYEGAGKGSYKTNSGDAVFTYRHASEWTQAEYESLGHSTGGKKVKPNCIQCHVAHGTDAAMEEHSAAVTLPNGTASNTSGTLNGDSFLLRLNNRGVCQTCHNK